MDDWGEMLTASRQGLAKNVPIRVNAATQYADGVTTIRDCVDAIRDGGRKSELLAKHGQVLLSVRGACRAADATLLSRWPCVRF